jgi:hypothetical protein
LVYFTIKVWSILQSEYGLFEKFGRQHFWLRFYIVILGMTFLSQTYFFFHILFGLLFPLFYLDFCFPFLFGLLFLFLTFISFFDFYFFFWLLFPFLHKSRCDLGFLPSFWSQDWYIWKMGDYHHFKQSVKICHICLIWVLNCTRWFFEIKLIIWNWKKWNW